ncbi:MAG: hypothetical protein ACERKN_10205 [Velocimicrobium sp.]
MHKKRFQSICKSGLFPKLDESYGYADAFVWSKTKSCVDSQLIHFEAIRIHGVDLDGYVIFHMEKELYSGKEHITVSELSDPELLHQKCNSSILCSAAVGFALVHVSRHLINTVIPIGSGFYK